MDYVRSLLASEDRIESFNQKVGNIFPGLIYRYDIDQGSIEFLNKRLTDLLGFSDEEMIATPNAMFSLVCKDDTERVKQELEKFTTLTGNSLHSYHCRLMDKAGNWRRFHTTGKVISRDSQQKPSSILFIAQDMSEQEDYTTEAPDISRCLFEETEALLQSGAWSLDLQSGHFQCTPGLLKMMGYTPGESECNDQEIFRKHVSPVHREAFDSAVSHAMQHCAPFQLEYALHTKSGDERIVATNGKVICDSAGGPRFLVAITRDITHFADYEKERERNIRELNRSNRELEEFAYVASHDLQEPLRKVSTFCERLSSRYGEVLDKEGNLYLNRVLAATDNMKILIDNLLDFSKAARSSRTFVTCDLHQIFQEVLSDQELKIEETGTAVRLSVQATLEGIPTELRQLFNNLLGNALKFRKKSGQPAIGITSTFLSDLQKIRHSLPAGRAYYEISIADNGIGFEPEYAEKIFQIFQRLHGKAEYPGAGIGLSICKKIIDNHNGIIYGASNGDGSTFTVILPEKQYV